MATAVIVLRGTNFMVITGMIRLTIVQEARHGSKEGVGTIIFTVEIDSVSCFNSCGQNHAENHRAYKVHTRLNFLKSFRWFYRNYRHMGTDHEHLNNLFVKIMRVAIPS